MLFIIIYSNAVIQYLCNDIINACVLVSAAGSSQPASPSHGQPGSAASQQPLPAAASQPARPSLLAAQRKPLASLALAALPSPASYSQPASLIQRQLCIQLAAPASSQRYTAGHSVAIQYSNISNIKYIKWYKYNV